MKFLYFDTETTGKLNYNAPAIHNSQPHLVQLCALLQDESGEIVSEVNLIVRPEGYDIPAEAAAIHRIDTALALSVGVRLSNACFIFRDLMERADIAVAHNIDFDTKIMQRAFFETDTPPLPWEQIPQRCTMKAATPLCKIPGPRGYKWPKLTEAHTAFFGVGVDGAHNATADTHACRRIHNYMVRIGAFGVQIA